MTLASVPADVRAHSIGPNLTTAIVYFAGNQDLSKRGIGETVHTLFGVPVAMGTIVYLEQDASVALEPTYQETRWHVS